jgi:hypothetical protein
LTSICTTLTTTGWRRRRHRDAVDEQDESDEQQGVEYQRMIAEMRAGFADQAASTQPT